MSDEAGIEQFTITIRKWWDPDAENPDEREVITTEYTPGMTMYDATAMLGFAFVTCPQDFARGAGNDDE